MKHENNEFAASDSIEPLNSASVPEGYRSVLHAELLRKQQVNPRYSLRRFAIHLGVSAATLCGVLRGSRKLSIGTAQKVAGRLELDEGMRAKFLLSVAEDFRKKETEAPVEVVAEQSLGA